MHFCFFKGNVDPIGSSEQRYGGPKHWPRADPNCDAKGKNNEAQIHGVPGKLIRTARNELAIDLGALAAEENKGQTGRIHEIATNEIPRDTSGKPGTLDQPKNQPIAAAVRM